MLKEDNLNKHVARFLAILSLYSYEMQEDKDLLKIADTIRKAYNERDIFALNISFNDLSQLNFHSPDEVLLQQLIDLSISKKQDIETLIKANLIAKYNFDRLDKVIKNIFRLAALELLYCGYTHAKVIIDEYVSLTKTFYENNEAGFVNKVIDVLAHKVRPLEVEQ